MQEHHEISSLLPPDLCNGCGLNGNRLHVPAWAFKPDAWSVAFLRGLRAWAKTFTGNTVWEVGVGTGLNQIFLSHWLERCVHFFSDFNKECTPLAVKNLFELGLFCTANHKPLFGSWDLLSTDRYRAPAVDAIVACIPQVPSGLDLMVGDNMAHYYNPDQYTEASLNTLGLGLNEALLRRARRVLNHNGQVVLNLGGRPGLRVLEQLFRSCGYAPRVIHEELIPQHAGTCLEGLAAMEANGAGTEFEFFTDSSAGEQINAREAENRRKRGDPLFHKIYVIRGRMT